MDIILVVVGTFALCFGVDKLFTKVFRSKSQHRSGLAVRLRKGYAIGGLLLTVLGIMAVIYGLTDTWLMTAGGVLLVVVGTGLIVYYMTFGIFYDADSFILTTFGKKSRTYAYRDIKAQQLYLVQGGDVLVELHLADGRTVQLQSTMEGVESFLDHAYETWLRQTGRNAEDCAFHDPANSCWFPPVEV